jgi:hypothetical protein
MVNRIGTNGRGSDNAGAGDGEGYQRRMVMGAPLGSRDASVGLWLRRPVSSAQR